MALLIGPNAPLALEPRCRATYSNHVHDFCKPAASGSPYPLLDGPATMHWFLHAAGECHAGLARNLAAAAAQRGGAGGSAAAAATATAATAAGECHADLGCQEVAPSVGAAGAGSAAQRGTAGSSGITAEGRSGVASIGQQSASSAADCGGVMGAADFFVSHAPFHSLVKKTFARLCWLDECAAAKPLVPAAAEPAAAAAAAPAAAAAAPAAAVAPAAAAAPVAAAGVTPRTTAVSQPGMQLGVCADAPAGEIDMSGAEASNKQAHPQQSGKALRLVEPASPAAGAAVDKALERQLAERFASAFNRKLSDGCWLQRRLGNLYTASLWAGLASLVYFQGGALAGRRVLLYSFGSGVMASLFALRGRASGGVVDSGSGSAGADATGSSSDGSSSGTCVGGNPAGSSGAAAGAAGESRFTLEAMQRALNLETRLAARRYLDIPSFRECMALAHAAMQAAAPFMPKGGRGTGELAAGAFYLVEVDAMHKRTYAQFEG